MRRTSTTPPRRAAVRRLGLAIALVVGSVSGAPGTAWATGDPASDVLLQQDVYYPYAPPASVRMRKALDRLLTRTREAGYPVKVALIQTPTDLGDLGRLFGNPALYARELRDELTRIRHGTPETGPLHLLVVFPSGLSGTGLGPRAGEALDPVAVNAAARSDGLVQAALQAIPRLAAVNGARVATPPEARIRLAASDASTKGSGPSPFVFFVPLVLVLVGAAVAGRLAGRRRDEPPAEPPAP